MEERNNSSEQQRPADRRRNPAPNRQFGRRSSDLDAEVVATRKLVVATVILVDALYLAGDALLFGPC